MSKGLALTRTTQSEKNELIFFVHDSSGKEISIKQCSGQLIPDTFLKEFSYSIGV